MKENGEIVFNHLQSKKSLDIFKKLCALNKELDEKSIEALNAQTRSGKHMSAYQQMQSDPSKPGYKRSLYHQGRILAALERSDEAIAMFREVLAKDPGRLESEVENRLAALENKKTP